jgi:uncharacterized membrane protein
VLHLIHPALVHFSVAFLVAGGVCEAGGILFRRKPVERFGGVLVIAGVLSLVPTVVAGFLAANSIVPPAGSEETLALHERAGLITSALFTAVLFWKAWYRGSIPERQRVPYALFVLAAVAAVAYASWLGGSLVYEYGVGVATG